MSVDIKQLRADVLGFSSGRFFFDGECGDLAYVGKDCDDKRCDCSAKLNSDGDQDCSVALGDMDHGGDTGEPIARMLNAIAPLLDLVDELRTARDKACDIARAFTQPSQIGANGYVEYRDRIDALRKVGQ